MAAGLLTTGYYMVMNQPLLRGVFGRKDAAPGGAPRASDKLAVAADKFGAVSNMLTRLVDTGGDFVTGPELTPLFGQTLATQVGEVMAASSPTVLEVGAGSGRLAADVLLELADQDRSPDRYLILELSGELRARQHQTLAKAVQNLLERVA